MQVSARLPYSEPAFTRSRSSAARPWIGDPVPAIRPDERGSGYRGTLARGSQQAVNDRSASGSADKQVFVARALTSTLAMLQMRTLPDESESPGVPQSASKPEIDPSFVDDLFAGVFATANPQ